MHLPVITVTFLGQLLIFSAKDVEEISPSDCKDVDYLVKSQGYPFEEHLVKTDDGYIVQLHRIPHGRAPCPYPCHRTPIYITTGFLTDSAAFVLNFPKQSLGFILADNGYDVWLGNTRGGRHGRRHTHLDPEGHEFWNFTFHEHAIFDAPSQIDYILARTYRSKLLYLGWSQGTLIYFIMLSERPEYNKKIKAFAGLAPVLRVTRMDVPLAEFASTIDELLEVLREKSPEELFPVKPELVVKLVKFCGLPISNTCAVLLDELLNLGTKYMNKTRFFTYHCNFPTGTSVKNAQHYMQLLQTQEAKMFDYGTLENRKIYGQDTPPMYTLKNVRTDVGAFWARGDKYIPHDQVEEDLLPQLGGVVKKKHFIDDPEYSHLSFAIALTNYKVLHPELLEFLNRYTR